MLARGYPTSLGDNDIKLDAVGNHDIFCKRGHMLRGLMNKHFSIVSLVLQYCGSHCYHAKRQSSKVQVVNKGAPLTKDKADVSESSGSRHIM